MLNNPPLVLAEAALRKKRVRCIAVFLISLFPALCVAVDEWIPAKSEIVDLERYGLSEGADITALMKKLAKESSPNLILKLPDNIDTLVLDYIDLSAYGVRRFALIEPQTPILLRQNQKSDQQNIMLKFSDYRNVYIGGPKGNITFQGVHKGVRGGHNARHLGDSGEGLLSFSQTRYLDATLYFGANIRDSRVYGLDHRGNTHGSFRASSVKVQGFFRNSGLRLNSGYKNADVNVHITDPYGVGFGWDGTDAVLNNGWNSVPPYWERSRGISMTYAEKITGKVFLEYGKASWFISSVNQIGNGKDDPFHIQYKDLGYSGSGIKIQTKGFLDTGGKVDHIGSPQGGATRHMFFEELEHDFGYGLRNSVVLEATSGDGHGKRVYYNEAVDIRLKDISARVTTAHLDYRGDYSKGHWISGSQKSDQKQPAWLELHESDVVDGFSGLNIRLKSFGELGRPSRNNELRNVTVNDGGVIEIAGDATDNRMTAVNFLGEPRRVIHISNRDYRGESTILHLDSIVAPQGSTIVADKPEFTRVFIDGFEVDLPFVIGEKPE